MTEQERKILDLVFSDDLDEMVLGVQMLKPLTCKECWLFLNHLWLEYPWCSKSERAKRIIWSLYPNDFSGDSKLLLDAMGWDDQVKTWAFKNPDLKHDPVWKFCVPAWLSPDDTAEYRRLRVNVDIKI